MLLAVVNDDAVRSVIGSGSILMSVVLLVVAVLWLLFPLIMLSKFNELLKVSRAQAQLLERIANRSAGESGGAQWPSSSTDVPVLEPQGGSGAWVVVVALVVSLGAAVVAYVRFSAPSL